MNKHRTAFQDSNKKKPMQQNIDNVLNQCQVKMKQMITKKQEIIKETNLIAGQSKILEGEIEHVKKYLEEKDNEMHRKEEEIDFLKKQIDEKQGEFGTKLKEIREKEERFKQGINKINSELASIEYGTLKEYSLRKFELKQKIEELLKEKEENKNLTEKLYNLTHDLSILEVKYLFIIYNIID